MLNHELINIFNVLRFYNKSFRFTNTLKTCCCFTVILQNKYFDYNNHYDYNHRSSKQLSTIYRLLNESQCILLFAKKLSANLNLYFWP